MNDSQTLFLGDCAMLSFFARLSFQGGLFQTCPRQAGTGWTHPRRHPFPPCGNDNRHDNRTQASGKTCRPSLPRLCPPRPLVPDAALPPTSLQAWIPAFACLPRAGRNDDEEGTSGLPTRQRLRHSGAGPPAWMQAVEPRLPAAGRSGTKAEESSGL